MELHWIESTGGPLVCANRSTAKHWRGTQASSTGSALTDYERACQATKYLSVVACGSEDVLLLGDEPLQSAFVQLPQGFAIVRWVSCESQDMAASALGALPITLPSIEDPVQFSVGDAGLLMFDSAEDGAANLTSVGMDEVRGAVSITTEKYGSPGHFEFLVHRFLRT